MCVINMNLVTSTAEGTTITSANGRYRLQGNSNWNNFSINLNDPKTPNITQLGTYELEVNVTNSAGATSGWESSTFEVSDNCFPEEVGECIKYNVQWLIADQGQQTRTLQYINCDSSNELLGTLFFDFPGQQKNNVCIKTNNFELLQEQNQDLFFTAQGECDV